MKLASLGIEMDHNTHRPHEQLAAPHPGHKSREAHAGHDRHAGLSVAMFRDKFWLRLALTIPVYSGRPTSNIGLDTQHRPFLAQS